MAANGQESLVSVVLAVYNGAEYLREAITSMLAQTHRNLELIVINDGSTDRTAWVVSEIEDERIRYFEQANQGISRALNRGIDLARGDYIARIDHDDFSRPERLEKQLSFLGCHPECGMVGTCGEIWSLDGPSGRLYRNPTDSLVLKFYLLLNNPFIHSSVMLRKRVFETIGGYSTDPTRQPPEDYELWSRVAREWDVANLEENLVVYREVPGSLSRDPGLRYTDRVINLSVENLRHATRDQFSLEDLTDTAALANGVYHRISEDYSLRVVKAVLDSAADGLSDEAGVPREMLRGHVRSRMRTVRIVHFKRRYGGAWRWLRGRP